VHGARARRLWVLALCALSGALGACAARRSGSEPVRAEALEPEGGQHPQGLREQIRRIITERVEPLRTEAELEAFLAEMEASARRRGYASALEVEPGMAAIRQVAGAHGPEELVRRQVEFSERMRALSPPPPPPPAHEHPPLPPP
jgi:hypothetical protein